MFVTNFLHISPAHIPKSKMCINMKSSTYYSHMKAKILANFQICIRVRLKVFEIFEIYRYDVMS